MSNITVVGDGPYKEETGPGSFMHVEIARKVRGQPTCETQASVLVHLVL